MVYPHLHTVLEKFAKDMSSWIASPTLAKKKATLTQTNNKMLSNLFISVSNEEAKLVTK
jgi:hypothetical protein